MKGKEPRRPRYGMASLDGLGEESLLGEDLCDVGKGENAHVVCLRLKV